METMIDICVCTFQREHVVATLRSLARLIVQPEWKINVIVADNDERPSAQERVETAAKELNLNLSYLHAPARNISVARNACLQKSTAPYLAFIDDDELAAPNWLEALMQKLEESKADIVLGFVRAIYEADAPDWMQRGDFHSTRPAWVNNKIITGYSCNVLMRWAGSKLYTMRFRKELGRSGGEDTYFFAAANKAGAQIVYAPDALVTEQVLQKRANLLWLLKRSFRSGQTHGLMLLEKCSTYPLLRIFHILLAAFKADICFIMCLFRLLSAEHRNKWLIRGALHAGVVAHLMGAPDLVQYG